VLRGDFVTAFPPWDKDNAYKGYAHRVERDNVKLKFDRKFHEKCLPGTRAGISFSFRRSSLRLCHQGVAQSVIDPIVDASAPASLLFPTASDIVASQGLPGDAAQEPVALNSSRLFDRRLNTEQKQAVESILFAKERGQRVPYIIFGPPGTGKTKTVCEAVLQLWRFHSSKVLVTAPSNTAADLLLERLSTALNPREMCRFMAYNRNPSEVKAEVMRYTRFDEFNEVFTQPPVQDLTEFGVVVATCCMAAKLYNLGLPRGMFCCEEGLLLGDFCDITARATYHRGPGRAFSRHRYRRSWPRR
jgi:helicase MOV-10